MVRTKKGNVLLPKNHDVFKDIKVYFSSDTSFFSQRKSFTCNSGNYVNYVG